jgi:hypothetical protein
MTIPVNHTRRARSMEDRLGPAGPPEARRPGPRIPHITRLMALAIKLQEMLDRGEIQDYVDIARLGYISRARASQIMNLTLLAPDIQEALLYSTEEIAITERDIRPAVREVSWRAQRALWEQHLADRHRSEQRRSEKSGDNACAPAKKL